MVSEILVTVVVPVHNTVKYLHKCVESIRAQSLREIEIILVDNLSDDGSSELCDEYSLLDSRIKVLHLSCAGASIARNAGIEIASAPYIGFVDSDDHIEPFMYEELLAKLLCNNAEMAYCNFCYEYADKSTESPFQNSEKTYLRSSDEVLREIMWDKVSSSACTKLFKKDLFDSLRFPEGVFFEDHMTTYKWVAMCDKIVWVDKTFYFYFQRESSTCHTLDPIKKYHYFLAEFSRLAFIRERALFNSKELFDTNTMIVCNCFMHFRGVLREVKPKFFREPIRDMRSKVQELLLFSKKQIGKKYYKRIRKISYFWPIYYFFHFYFKDRAWKP